MKFLMTEESGRLTRWLRLMGCDVTIGASAPLSDLYRRAYNESRTLVTRNGKVSPSCLVRVIQLASTDLNEQLRQLMRETDLDLDATRRFSRCDQCNVPVEPIAKAQVKERVPPYVFKTQRTFHTCPSCRRIYWAATHVEHVNASLEQIRS